MSNHDGEPESDVSFSILALGSTRDDWITLYESVVWKKDGWSDTPTDR
jgi:hypothetical protein